MNTLRMYIYMCVSHIHIFIEYREGGRLRRSREERGEKGDKLLRHQKTQKEKHRKHAVYLGSKYDLRLCETLSILERM